MLKKIFCFSILLFFVGSLLLGVKVQAFEELKEEWKEEEQNYQQAISLQGVAEVQMLDFGAPWVGGRVDIPTEIDIPGREINPDYIRLEGFYKLKGYDDKEAFQGRGSFKYDLGSDMYTQLGVGYLNVGGVSGLTGVVQTGLEIPIGSLKLDVGLVGQRTLLGAIIDEYDNHFWLGVNLGFGF